MNYTDLKTKQQNFIHLLDAAVTGTVDENTTFKRGFLKKIANDNGIAWAPAWIVKDTSRCKTRGEYLVPELADYRAGNTSVAPKGFDHIVTPGFRTADDIIDEGMEKIGETIAAEEGRDIAGECCEDVAPVRPDHISETAWGLLSDEEQMAAVA